MRVDLGPQQLLIGRAPARNAAVVRFPTIGQGSVLVPVMERDGLPNGGSIDALIRIALACLVADVLIVRTAGTSKTRQDHLGGHRSHVQKATTTTMLSMVSRPYGARGPHRVSPRFDSMHANAGVPRWDVGVAERHPEWFPWCHGETGIVQTTARAVPGPGRARGGGAHSTSGTKSAESRGAVLRIWARAPSTFSAPTPAEAR